MSIFFHILGTGFTLWDAIFMLIIAIRGTVLVNVTILEKEAFMTLLLIYEMGPKVAFIDQGALVMARKVINVIKVEDVDNVVQFCSTDIIVWDTWINWRMIRPFKYKELFDFTNGITGKLKYVYYQ